MAVSPDYRDYVLEQLPASLAITHRAMFGGVGIYAHGLFFALIAEDVLYLKVDDTNRGDFEALGCEAFQPFGAPKPMNYFAVPAEVLDDPEDLGAWARRALDVAARAKGKA